MADRLHLQLRHRRMLESLLREHLPDVEVWAYGSRVTGRSHDGSDLDLVLRGPGLGKIPVGQLADFEEAVRESNIPFLVEARDWARLPERFHAEIHSRHVVFVGAPGPIAKWRTVRLGDHIDSCLGKMLDKKKNRGELLPYLGNKNVRWGSFDITNLAQMRFEDHEHDRYGLEHGDLVVCEGGEPGRCAIWRGEVPRMKIQKALHRIRTKEQLDSRYLHYWFLLSGRRRTLEPYFTGTTIKHLTAVSLSDLQIRLPPKPEQEAIAHILGTLDDKIELSRRMNETLEAMARTLFKSWFVDFEPVRAKMEGRDTGLPDHVADLFPCTLDNEHIPCGWSLVSLAALAAVNPESWSSRNVPEEVEYVDLANTKWGTIESTQRYRWQEAPSRARRILRPGDTIIGTVRPGNGSFAFIGSRGLTGSTGFAVLRPHQCRHRALVFLAATAPENIERLTHLADGAAYPAVRPQVVGATRVVVADQALIDVFSDLASPVLDQIHSNKEQNRALAQIRDILLPKLISGEIRIADAERAVGAVA